MPQNPEPRTPIYLDHSATTPLDARVFEVMLPYLKEQYGNASSVHALGRKARFAVEESRERIAAMIGVAPGDVVFTSGGTEANNLALKGSLKYRAGGVLASRVEHEAVLTPLKRMAEAGLPVTWLPVTRFGEVTTAAVESHLSGAAIVSCMHANNEVGTLNDVARIGALCGENRVLFHSDAVQSAGWFNWKQVIEHVDMLSISSHKFYGPKGVGCLVISRNADPTALIEGGSQERRRRGGTENVAGIVGFAEALSLAVRERDERVAHLRQLQQRLIDGITAVLAPGSYVLNTPASSNERAPHIVNIAFPEIEGRTVDGEMLILNLDMEGVMVSSGSACTSGAIEPSHVLLGLGLERETATAAIRFSMGKDNTPADIDYAVDKLDIIMKRMRG